MKGMLEGEARAILERAGFDDTDAPGALAIARGLGIDVVTVPGAFMGGVSASLECIKGRYIICLPRRLPPTRANWCIAHELAELRLRELGCTEEDVEARADAIAAGLAMPWRAFRWAVGELGREPAALAEEFLVDQTAATLRLAEVCAVEVAVVVTPEQVYRRGEEWAMPDDQLIRRQGLDGFPSARRVRITDAPRRIGWLAAA